MQNLKFVSDQELHLKTLAAANSEKSATLALLEHLVEVDHRRLYAVMGYASLWEYTHKALGYSESQSSERVSAMRLMVKVPEVRQELATGKVTLTAVSKLAYHVKREQLVASEARDLLAEIKSKSIREVERILVAETSAEATRITIEVDSEFIELMNRAKELKGNLALSPKEVFKATLHEFVKRREVKVPQVKVPKVKTDAKSNNEKNTDENSRAALHLKKVLLTPLRTRYISAKTKSSVRIRSNDQCEYIAPDSKKRCESKTGLQFDHRVPFAVNGPNTEENIRYLCPAHNRLAAVQFFGREKMEQYLKSG